MLSSRRQLNTTISLGVVEYCDYVRDIWSGISSCFAESQVDLEPQLFSTYESLSSALLQGKVDVAWNGNLAHVRLLRQTELVSLGMRDTDQNFTSVLVTHHPNPPSVNHSRVSAGSLDSAQAYILPFFHLSRTPGVSLSTLRVTRYDRDLGKHGDTALGEELALADVVSGRADFCVVSNLMYTRGLANKSVPASCHVVRTFPPFDHCIFDALPTLSPAKRAAFSAALFAMNSSSDDKCKAVMKLEGIDKEWRQPREHFYVDLAEADAGPPFQFASLTVA